MNDILFQIATRAAFRYESPIGPLTTEQLWTLPLLSTRTDKPSLNDCAVRLSKSIKEQGDESFVENRTNTVKAMMEQKLDVVKHIIEQRQKENADATAKAASASQRAKIDEIIASKKDEALTSMSLEELEAMKNTL